MSNTKKVVLILGGLTVIAVLLCVIIFAVLFESMGRPSVPQNSVLVLKVSGDLPDYAPEDPTARLLGINQPQSFSSLLTQLRKAKVDNRIGGIVLDINFPGIGWGKADELRDAIKDFRASGKPAYAYMQIGTNKEYYIATAAEKIFVAPAGDLYVNGFAASVSFYRGSLDKLGIEPQFLKIGKYKNAPDQYTEKSMTEPHREVINAILDEYYGRMTKAIADERKKSVEDVKALIDNAPYHADDALQVGLIDGASYRDQVYDELKTRLGYKTEEALRTIPANEYREISSDSLGLNKGEKIAIVYASGAINIGSSNNGPFGGETMGSDTIVKAVNTAANDPSIKAIVLRVDSPGGSSLASDLMWHALENAKAKKPVVVSMADVAASGGYYISCNANKIVAQPSTVTGSIGVFMGKPVMKGFYDWLGISNEYVMRGKNSGIFRETEKWSGTELEKMQKQVEKIYFNDFVHEKAIEIAKELANLPADRDVKRISFPEPRPFFDTMFGSSEENTMTQEQQAATALVKSLPEEMRRSFRYAAMLDQMRNGEAMLLLPYELEVK
ncbi:MAG: S49 family peptidase [Acidobacteria bacterium]|nr:S49 family peptidase [Acidobacteriota bacterium]